MIILNEIAWVEDVIHNPDIGEQPFETFRRLARYYLDRGYSEEEARDNLDVFLIRCDATASLVKWSDFLDGVMKAAKKHPLVNIDEIVITKSEMEIISSIKQRQAQRLAFTLLCLAKFRTVVNPECNYWVSDSAQEIMKLADIKTSMRKQSKMYYDLHEDGLLEFAVRVDNTSVRVTFVNEESEPVLHINDFRNLGYQYMQYTGVECAQCENCGLIMSPRSVVSGRPQKYCGRCASEIATKQRVDWMTKHREYITNL